MGRQAIGRMALMFVLAAGAVAGVVFANGGPFVVKYPGGDPAAKGVLARLGTDLMPARETRLRVLKEDLEIAFLPNFRFRPGLLEREDPGSEIHQPGVNVSAEYAIQNPTDEDIEVDFGFPILRGVYILNGMEPRPAVDVLVNGKVVTSVLISNSAIYGIIRQRAGVVIEKALSEQPTLRNLVAAVKGAEGAEREAAREALAAHLTGEMKWNERDAALMVEYASMDLGQAKSEVRDSSHDLFFVERELYDLEIANLGPLAAIGEQKATQFFAQLASRFDPAAAAAYEAIFTAWGGDVRERSVDLKTGEVRPREIAIEPSQLEKLRPGSDPTVYARVDYFDEKAPLTDEEKASCKSVLKNLPVVFTFAPMNLLYYRATFPAGSTQTLTVAYRQYAFSDTREPASYQLAYVVHPASLWDNFGPINVEVRVSEGVPFRASVPFEKADAGDGIPTYRAKLNDKTGELLVAVGAEAWKKAVSQESASKASVQARPSASADPF